MTAMDTARRVTVVTPSARVDVALPVESTVAELLPQLMALAGVEDARADGGWSLSRLGGAPIEGGLSVSAAGVRDGEVLYLRPRATVGAPLLFDDVIDAIASAAETPRSAWQASTARLTALAGAALALGLTAIAIYLSTPKHSSAAIGCAVLAVILAVAGGALARAYSDATAGFACGLAGIVPAYLAGAAASTSAPIYPIGARTVALGLVAVTIYAALAAVLIGDRLPLFVTVIGASAVGAAGAAVVLINDARPASAAAVCLAVALISGFYAPMLSLRLSRLPLPRVPADVEAFREDESATLGPDVLGQTTEAAGLLAGLLGAAGLVLAGAALVLVHDRRPVALWLAAVAGLASLLRSRSYAAAAPRIVLLGAGTLALGWLAADQLLDGSAGRRVLVAALAGLASVLALAYAGRVAQGRSSPYWSRLLDFAEIGAVIAVLPLAGSVVGLYSAVRR
ncbi:MAG: type VII secretion integral membrane protein EccD [Jatrophihabitantaceae bacterium]